MLLAGQKVYVGPFLKKSDRPVDRESHFTNVYVKNLPDSITDEKLNEMFSEHGSVTSAVVMKVWAAMSGNQNTNCARVKVAVLQKEDYWCTCSLPSCQSVIAAAAAAAGIVVTVARPVVVAEPKLCSYTSCTAAAKCLQAFQS